MARAGWIIEHIKQEEARGNHHCKINQSNVILTFVNSEVPAFRRWTLTS